MRNDSNNNNVIRKEEGTGEDEDGQKGERHEGYETFVLGKKRGYRGMLSEKYYQ